MMKLSTPVFKLKRKAKLLAREQAIPLHQALDRVAMAEGFQRWSQLAGSTAMRRPAERILDSVRPGDMMLLGARPGQGKTMIGLELAALSPRIGRRGVFFTLDYTGADVAERLGEIGAPHDAVVVDASDDICAAYIIEQLADGAGRAVAVVDYLQLLDQRRSTPPLDEQLAMLGRAAQESGMIIVMISQIDRRFDASDKALPDVSDIRRPNPFDPSLFTRTCFIHDGAIKLSRAA